LEEGSIMNFRDAIRGTVARVRFSEVAYQLGYTEAYMRRFTMSPETRSALVMSHGVERWGPTLLRLATAHLAEYQRFVAELEAAINHGE